MRYRVIVLTSLVSLAACGDNAAKLARNADPKVCAASATTEEVFAIMKQQAGYGIGNIQDSGITGAELLEDISMTAADVTSKSVDKDAQTVECNATIKVSGKGLTGTEDQSVDYQVKPNLSDDNKIVVSVARSEGIQAVSAIMGNLFRARLKSQETVVKPDTVWEDRGAAATNVVQPLRNNGFGDCSITVDEVNYLDLKGNCPIDKSDDLMTINAQSDEKKYFAYITIDGDGGAQINWNGKEQYNKAEEDLGEDFRLEGNCWKNAKATICADLK